MRQAVILCGGKGLRLAHITGNLPKGLAPLAGKPILVRQIEELRRHGIEEVILCVGYKAEAIRSFFGDGRAWGVTIRYAQEQTPLGTAGAVRAIQHPLDPHFVVIYGDLLFCLDLTQLARHHVAHGALATLVLHPSDHPSDSDLVVMDRDLRITAWPGRPRPGQPFVNLTNAAVYIVNRHLLSAIPEHKPTDFARDVFPARVRDGAYLVGYVTHDYCKDIGQEDRYRQALEDLHANKVHAASCTA